MFKVDESSIGRHLWERRPWARGMLDESGRKINNNSGDKNVATSGDIGSGHDVVLGPEDGDDDQDVDVKSDDQGGDIGSSAEDVSQQKKSDSTSSSSSVISEPGEDAKGEGGDQDGINDISDEVEDGEDDDFEFPDTQVNTMGQVTQASTTTPLKLPPSTSSSSSNDKYNLNSLNDGVEDLDVGDEEGENTGNGGNSSSTTSANMRKYISAKERRQMKKAASKAGGDEDKASTVPAPSSTHNPSTKSQSQSSAQQQQEQKQVRGKKGKQKKMKEKYADQDEEDREQILEFLGSAKGPQPKGKRAKEAARKKEETEARKAATSKLSRVGGGGGGGKGKPAATGNTSTSDVVSKPKTLQTISGGGGGEEDEDNNVSATVYADKKINTGEEMLGDEEKNEIRRMLEEENVAVVDEDQSQLLTYLDSLTGQPHPDDVLMHAIPVCAPWAALSKFKYKVKLLPGSLKKGKASKSAVAAFLSRRETSAATTTTNEGGGGGAVSSSDSSREKDLIRSIPEAELVSAILGKIKVVVTASDAVDSRKSKGGWKKK